MVGNCDVYKSSEYVKNYVLQLHQVTLHDHPKVSIVLYENVS